MCAAAFVWDVNACPAIIMNVKTKVTAQIVGLFVILVAGQFALQRRILLPSFAELERQAAATDMDRVIHAFDRESDLLSVSAHDWGNWADTYAFMQNHNAQYITANLTRTAIAALKIDALAFVATDGHYVVSIEPDSDPGSIQNIDLFAEGRLPDNHPWRTAVRNGRPMSGLLMTNRGPMLAVMQPILNGFDQGPHHGMVLFGRLMTDAELARIATQAQVRLTANLMPTARDAADGAANRVVEEQAVTEVFHVMNDIEGRPALRLRIDVPRAITARGYKAVAFASVFVAGSGAIVLLVMLFLLNRSVLAPLARMTRHVVAIGAHNDLTRQLDLSRSDELGVLARAFDRTVGHLADARHQLVQQSFLAGIADHASGVLHNLRNAMTPLTVHIGALQSTLRAAPVADVDRVLAELDTGAVVATRKADLEAFLRLTSREIVRAVIAGCHDADIVERSAASIEAVLSQSARGARAANVLEFTRLSRIIEQSSALVPLDLMKYLTVEIDASLRSIDTVRVASTILQQVFQNLMVNAAESLREAGRADGSLKIAGHLTTTPTSQTLHLRFADNGIGISAENLPHIFDRGFSTKLGAGNSGIGLHWCANAINELGGTLQAESAGCQSGATFIINLPLEVAAVALTTKVA